MNPPGSSGRSTAQTDSGAIPAARLWILFAVALAIRLLDTWWSAASVAFSHPIVDALTYDRQGWSLAQGLDPFVGKPFWQPPGYPYFLSVIDLIAGHSFVAPRLVQAVLGAATAVLVARIGAAFFGARAGLAAGFVCAFEGILVYFDGRLLTPSLTIFLQVLAVCCAVLAASRSRPWLFAAFAGVALGGASITTATSLVLVPILAWHLRRRAPVFLLGVACAVAPITWHNLRAGDPVLVSSNGGINLYLGNNPQYDAMVGIRPGDRWTKLVQEPPVVAARQPSADSAYFTGKVRDWMRADPAAFLRLQLHKLRLFVGGHEVPRNEEIYAARASSPVLAGLLWQVPGLAFPWGLLLPLAVLGMLVSGRRARVLVWLIAAEALVVLAFFVTARYRAPLVPLLAIFAVEGVRALRSITIRRVPALAIAAAVFVISNVGQGAMAHTLNADAQAQIGDQLVAEGRIAEALALCEGATRAAPSNPDVWQSLGVVYRQAGRLKEAEHAMRRALDLAPDNAEAWANLGTLLAEEGRFDEGISDLAWSAVLPPLPSARGRQALTTALHDALCDGPSEPCVAKADAFARAGGILNRVEHDHGGADRSASQVVAAALRRIFPTGVASPQPR